MDIRGFDPKKVYRLLDNYVCDDRAQTYISHGDLIKVGSQVRFRPLVGIGLNNVNDADRTEFVGTINYVNYEHKWFGVEYGNPKKRTSFNFGDIGYTVHFCEED
jgi:hypothetical protein